MASYMGSGSGTARLVTSAEARAAAGEAPATIRIRNLQSVVRVGTDAWGRHGRTQPILVSAEVGLKQTFGAAANSDSVSADTVHYGTLTKAILGFLEENFGPNVPPNPTAVWTLKCALEGLWARLTGLCIWEILLGGYPDRSQPPVLNATQLRSLAITFHLPKASLAGDGVSLTAMCVYGNRAGVYSMSLCLHNLRQRTLIGVNPNERLAKQVVGTTVEIDKYTLFEDEYATLENLVVEVCESISILSDGLHSFSYYLSASNTESLFYRR